MDELKMQYPLVERIGVPELLVGRKKEFGELDDWLRGVHRRASWSVALLGRKKSGKQRLSNVSLIVCGLKMA
jgi:hypothetical protein